MSKSKMGNAATINVCVEIAQHHGWSVVGRSETSPSVYLDKPGWPALRISDHARPGPKQRSARHRNDKRVLINVTQRRWSRRFTAILRDGWIYVFGPHTAATRSMTDADLAELINALFGGKAN